MKCRSLCLTFVSTDISSLCFSTVWIALFKTVTTGDSLKVIEHEGQVEDASKAFWFQAIAYPLELIEEI